MTVAPGHNQGVAGDRLKSFVERIEAVSADIKGLQDDRKEIYAELKGEGFDTKTVRRIVAQRQIKASDRAEQRELLEAYASALGMDDIYA